MMDMQHRLSCFGDCPVSLRFSEWPEVELSLALSPRLHRHGALDNCHREKELIAGAGRGQLDPGTPLKDPPVRLDQAKAGQVV